MKTFHLSLPTRLHQGACTIALTALAALAVSGPAQAATYSVQFNTNAFAGTAGTVEFQWQIDSMDPALTASVRNFSGPVLSGALQVYEGSPTGSFASGGTVRFLSSDLVSYVYQPVTFGSTVSFLLTLPDVGPGTPPTLPNVLPGSSFGVFLYDTSLTPLLSYDPLTGASLEFNLQPGLAPTVSLFTTAATVSVQVAAIPEPSTYALSLLGLVAIGAWRRRVMRAA